MDTSTGNVTTSPLSESVILTQLPGDVILAIASHLGALFPVSRRKRLGVVGGGAGQGGRVECKAGLLAAHRRREI